MTSKQVRAAHKAATRVPKLSRAERIRQEKEEQERIRKELDKERASSRARVARQRKRDKEETERQNKRRNGLPLVNVRPSQDTIAKFVRGNGTTKKRDAAGEPVAADESLAVQHEQAADEPASPVEEETIENAVESRAEIKEQELDLIPEEDELELEMLEHLENMTRGPLPSVDEASTTRQATHYEVDLGLRPRTPTKPPEEDQEPVKPPGDIAPARQPSSSPSPSPSPPRQQPPLSTQAILCNYDDYFPSPSQQERELLEDDFSNTPTNRHPCQYPEEVAKRASGEAPDVAPGASSPTLAAPKRFFSASGSNELYSLALHRSRRDAALDSIRRREREYSTHQMHRQPPPPPPPPRSHVPRGAHHLPPGNPKPPPRTSRPASQQQLHNSHPHSRPQAEQTRTTRTTRMVKPSYEDKENASPDDYANKGIIVAAAAAPTASQETEYGGDWVDEIALELTI